MKMGWRWALACLLASGCIQAQLQPCGDLLCPVDSVCLPDNTCATQESIEVCMGKTEGDTCSTALFTGSCARGVCTAPFCGDGVVSGSEQCDGPVSGVDCVEYGFDTGVPTCSDRCGLDVVGSCVRFGWDRVLTQPVSRAAVSNGRILLLSPNHYTIDLVENGVTLQEQTYDGTDDTFFMETIAIRGGIAVAGQYGQILRSDDGGPFVADVPPQLNDTMISVAIGDDGSVYASGDDGGVSIYRKAPGTSVWTTVLVGTRHATFWKWLGDALYVAWDDNEVQKWQPGGAFTHVMTAPSQVYWMSLRPGGGYFITADNNTSYDVVGTTFTPFGYADYSQIYAIGSLIYAGGDSNYVVRRSGPSYDVVNSPIYGSLMVDGNDLYVYGNGVYKFSGTQFADRLGSGDPARDIKLLSNGEPIMATVFDALVLEDLRDWNYIQAPQHAPVAVAGLSATDFYVAEVDDIVHFDDPGFSDTNAPTTLAPLDIAMSSTTLYAVGKAGVSARLNGAIWSMLTGVASTCDMAELAIVTSGIYAAGTCGTEGVIWKLGGTTWSEVHRVAIPLVSLSVDAADNIYAAGNIGSISRVGGTWNDVAGPAGNSISATTPSDVWVGGGPDELVHYDGTIWSRVRLVGAANPQVLATDRAVYICGASDSVLLR